VASFLMAEATSGRVSVLQGEAHLKIFLADIQPSAPLVQQLHETPPADDETACHARPEGPQGLRV
jgi:hypothetical protein